MISSATQGTQIINPAPIPAGVPVFAAGQQVTFTIGKRVPNVNSVYYTLN